MSMKPLAVEPVLLSATPISTFNGSQLLTRATGFFFERGSRLFLITSRHVVIDEAGGHHPDRLEILLHTDAENLATTVSIPIPLYKGKEPLWRQGIDGAGQIDVAAIEIPRRSLPPGAILKGFTPQLLPDTSEQVEIGAPVLILGFPMGFHDPLHHLPVVRQAVVASPFGLRFRGQGYFLTDARTHRGSSGAPVILRSRSQQRDPAAPLPWRLLGVHSARLDVPGREEDQDEALGLNCAWYSDILTTLTDS